MAASAVTLAACDRATQGVPQPGTDAHAQAVRDFRVGVAAFQVGDDERAEARLGHLTTVAPGEPAGWANWGALALRQGRLEQAEQRLQKARALAAGNHDLQLLWAALKIRQGQGAEALAALRKASELQPASARATYALAQEVERQGGPQADAQALQLMRGLLARRPDSVAALVDVARLAAKAGDLATLGTVMGRLDVLSTAWPDEVREQVRSLQEAVGTGDLRGAGLRTVRLRNVLQRVPDYRDSLDEIKPPAVAETPAMTELLAMRAAPPRTAAPDAELRFETAQAAPGAKAGWAGVLQLDPNAAPVLASDAAAALPGGATLPFVAGDSVRRPESVLQVDFSYDFKTDLVLASGSGVRLLQQGEGGAFKDVTAATGLPAAVTQGKYTGAWAADIEADGDLDVVLGAEGGEILVLQNNGDGTFSTVRPFAGVTGLRQFLWVDLDGDGAPEAVLLDGASRLHVFMNRRQGQYRERALPSDLGVVRALAAVSNPVDGLWALALVRAEGGLVRLAGARDGEGWRSTEIGRIPASLAQGELRLHAADFDNNGAADLLLARIDAATAALWLADVEAERYVAVKELTLAARVLAVADVNGDGRLDLVGLDADGKPVRALNKGSRAYHWQVVRPRAAQSFGDQRINPYGVGGEVELRAGSIVQKALITGPVVHFGLGEEALVDVIRVGWPNGVMQAEFEAKADQSVAAEQRLKGSCPFLFAWDGKEMKFVKDAVPWGSAIGLRINMLGTAKVEATEEWYRIGRDELAARNGEYDLRISAELWEVYYYDHFGLMTVDHPAGTEIYVDERFAIPAVRPEVVVVDTPRAIQRAEDDEGRDVTALVATLDGKAVDGFGHGQYQGVSRDHYLEIELGDAAPADQPLMLVAHGSLRPTDSSVNVALSQGKRWQPKGMSLEVQDANGKWRVARDNLGFPAGRKKIVLFDLAGLLPASGPKRVRIRTNLEIYWDKIEWAKVRKDVAVRTQRLQNTVADLHYRGYSVLTAPPAGAPEIPAYQRLAGSAPRWRDLEGYYTRHGDVRELLAGTDDRYVIMNAGDEMTLRFAEPAAPPAGWLRDFVVMGDGWIKDGDYNSTFSRTVQPLPHHGENLYTRMPQRLQDEVVWQRHSADWDSYHTRYVTGEPAARSLAGARRRLP